MGKRLQIFFLLGIMTIPTIAAGEFLDDFDVAHRMLTAGKYDEAVGIYGQIAAHHSNPDERARALLLEGTARGFILGSPTRALACFEKILLLHPTSPAAPDALFQSGIIYYGQGRFEPAFDAFSTYVEEYPHGPRYASAAVWLSRIEPKTDDLSIRVLVADKATRLAVRSEKALVFRDVATGRRVCTTDLAASVASDTKGLIINDRATECRQVWVTTAADFLFLNDCRSRGAYIITATDDGLRAVNQVPLEQYLYGIVSKEMSDTWHREALMAQAVASRTYVLYTRARSRRLPYDVTSSTASQVYGGVDAERTATNKAVDATRGQVMTFDGRLIAAYFHADSGGHTEDARFVWDVDIPYLKGVPDKFSDNISGNNWECHLSFDRISKKLKAAGMVVGGIRQIRILEKSPTDRVLKIQVTSDTGDVVLSGNHFRVNLDPTCIRSTCFRVNSQSDGAYFQGRGYGHGVGMSQWGANRAADTGFTYRQILDYYYPGTVITDVGAEFDKL